MRGGRQIFCFWKRHLKILLKRDSKLFENVTFLKVKKDAFSNSFIKAKGTV
jgi:hypothetical protein